MTRRCAIPASLPNGAGMLGSTNSSTWARVIRTWKAHRRRRRFEGREIVTWGQMVGRCEFLTQGQATWPGRIPGSLIMNNEAKQYKTIDKFDRLMGALVGLPDVTHTKPTTCAVHSSLIGAA